MRMKVIDVISSRLLLIFSDISEKFPEILNFQKLHNPKQQHLTKTNCVVGDQKLCVLPSVSDLKVKLKVKGQGHRLRSSVTEV